MKNLKKDLQSINKDLKALSKRIDKMIVAVGKLEKPKVAKKTKAKAVKPKPKKKIVAKKTAAKKVTKTTAADTVFNIIKRYKKGVGTVVLVKKTGFNEKKIYNIVYRLKKQGLIKNVGKGVYLKA
ncbi:MAG: hypothetical protein JRG75_10875 [Deltaproteobacteria bacterium]|nr:hypothetical protein [Deltaproteobacteria bacterium]